MKETTKSQRPTSIEPLLLFTLFRLIYPLVEIARQRIVRSPTLQQTSLSLPSNQLVNITLTSQVLYCIAALLCSKATCPRRLQLPHCSTFQNSYSRHMFVTILNPLSTPYGNVVGKNMDTLLFCDRLSDSNLNVSHSVLQLTLKAKPRLAVTLRKHCSS